MHQVISGAIDVEPSDADAAATAPAALHIIPLVVGKPRRNDIVDLRWHTFEAEGKFIPLDFHTAVHVIEHILEKNLNDVAESCHDFTPSFRMNRFAIQA